MTHATTVAIMLAAAGVCCACIGVLAAVVYVIRHHLVNRAASMSVTLKNPQKLRGPVLFFQQFQKIKTETIKNTAKTHMGVT